MFDQYVFLALKYSGTVLTVLIGSVFAVYLMMAWGGVQRKAKRPEGVDVFAFLLVFASFYKLYGFLDYDYYQFMFQQLPEDMIRLRYSLSIALRLMTISIAIGLILLKELSRKALLCLGWLTLMTLYWKHPFYVFENIAALTQKQLAEQTGAPDFFPWVSFTFFVALDIIFTASYLYYFNKKTIKPLFS